MNSILPTREAFVLRPHGKLHAAAAAALLAMVGGEVASEDPRTIVLDLRAVTSISHSGLDALMACRRRALETDTDLELLCTPGPAFDHLEAAGLSRLFVIRD